MSEITQESKVLKMLRSAGKYGVENFKFPEARILCYTKAISRLREDGHNIITERVYLPNNRATNVYVYTLIEPKKKWWKRG